MDSTTPAPALDWNHAVPVPWWTSHVRIAQAIIAFIVFLFVVVPMAIWGSFAAFSLGIFTCIATIIILAYEHVASRRLPKLYNRWAILALEIFAVIFWLVTFALLANWCSVYFGNDYNHDVFGGNPWPFGAPHQVYRRSVETRSLETKYSASRGLAGAAAGLGAVEFILFTLTLIFFSKSLHYHRIAGFHSTYDTPRTEFAGPHIIVPATKSIPAEEPLPLGDRRIESTV